MGWFFADASAVFEGMTFTSRMTASTIGAAFYHARLLHGWVVIIVHTEYND